MVCRATISFDTNLTTNNDNFKFDSSVFNDVEFFPLLTHTLLTIKANMFEFFVFFLKTGLCCLVDSNILSIVLFLPDNLVFYTK